jgi:hypothetical protein
MNSRIFNMLRHPYYESAVVLARAASCFATVLWSAIVLIRHDPLNYPMDLYLTRLMPAWVWAVGGLFIAGSAMWRLFRRDKPIKLGVIAYVLITMFWMHLFFTYWINQVILPPGAAAGITLVTLLSVYGLIANPRKRNNAIVPG